MCYDLRRNPTLSIEEIISVNSSLFKISFFTVSFLISTLAWAGGGGGWDTVETTNFMLCKDLDRELTLKLYTVEVEADGVWASYDSFQIEFKGKSYSAEANLYRPKAYPFNLDMGTAKYSKGLMPDVSWSGGQGGKGEKIQLEFDLDLVLGGTFNMKDKNGNVIIDKTGLRCASLK